MSSIYNVIFQSGSFLKIAAIASLGALLGLAVNTANGNNLTEAAALENRALSRMHSGDSKAVDDYNQACRLGSCRAAYRAACLYEQTGDDKSAVLCLNEIIKINCPERVEAYNTRAVIRAKTGDYIGSIEDCDRAIELDSNYAYSYRNRGVAESKLGREKAALMDFARALELKPNNPHFLSDRALVLSHFGHYENALIDIGTVLKTKPTFTNAYYTRALIRVEHGDKKGAIKDLERISKPLVPAQQLMASLRNKETKKKGI